jgi:hypothetical protein
MALLVVRTSNKLVLVGLDVVLESLVAFHCDGTMTSYWSHVIAKLQLYSCFAEGPGFQLLPDWDTYYSESDLLISSSILPLATIPVVGHSTLSASCGSCGYLSR